MLDPKSRSVIYTEEDMIGIQVRLQEMFDEAMKQNHNQEADNYIEIGTVMNIKLLRGRE